MKKILVLSFVFYFVLHVPQIEAAEPAMDAFLDRVSSKLDSLDNKRPHTVEVTSIVQEMDGHWRPKKETIIQELVTKRDTVRTVKIIKAIVKEKGKETDVTQKVNKDQKKQGKKRGIRFGAKDFFPFDRQKRNMYVFQFLPDTTIKNSVVKVLKVKALKPDEDLFNGTYFINAKTAHLVRLNLHPSKNPKMVKEMKLRMNFGINDFGNYIVKDFETITFAQFLLKKYRYKIVEKYKNYKFLDEMKSS